MELPKNFAAPETDVDNLKKKYNRLTLTFQEIAKSIVGMSLPEETLEKWKVLLSSVRLIDDEIDQIEDKEKRDDLIEKIKAKLDGYYTEFDEYEEVEKGMRLLEDISMTISEEKRSFLHKTLKRILNTTKEIKDESNSHKVVKLTLLEGQMTARIFTPFLPEEFTKSDNYQNFLKIIILLGRTGNSFDTLVDLERDFANNQVVIEPSLLNKIRFLGAFLVNAKSLLANLPLSEDMIKRMLLAAKSSIRGSHKSI